MGGSDLGSGVDFASGIMRRVIPHDHYIWAKYMKIPFVAEGRSAAGADCWGLVRLIYKNELDIELPVFAGISPSDTMRVVRVINGERDVTSRWVPLSPETELIPYDVCVLKVRNSRVPGHVGLMIDSRNLIHIEEGAGVNIVPLTHITVKERIASFHRYQELV